MADFDALPRGVKALSRGEDVIRYAARVGGPGGVCTFGEFETAHAAGAAWDTEMRRRFPFPAVAPLLNDASAGAAAAGEDPGGSADLLEALLGDDAWHDVVLCGAGRGTAAHWRGVRAHRLAVLTPSRASL
jgi:hypothetical protein